MWKRPYSFPQTPPWQCRTAHTEYLLLYCPVWFSMSQLMELFLSLRILSQSLITSIFRKFYSVFSLNFPLLSTIQAVKPSSKQNDPSTSLKMWEKSEEGNENVDVFCKKYFLTADLEEKICVHMNIHFYPNHCETQGIFGNWLKLVKVLMTYMFRAPHKTGTGFQNAHLCRRWRPYTFKCLEFGKIISRAEKVSFTSRLI